MKNLKEKVEIELIPNYQVLGPILGSKVKNVATALLELPSDLVSKIVSGHIKQFQVEDEMLTRTDVEFRLHPKKNLHLLSEEATMLLLESKLTPDLVEEGKIKDLVRHIQVARKQLDLDLDQMVQLHVDTSPEMRNVVLKYKKQLTETLLLTKLEFNKLHPIFPSFDTKLGNQHISFQLVKDN